MKTYSLIPGLPPVVLVSDDSAPLRALSGSFGWGKDCVGLGPVTLAKAILVDVLGDAHRSRADLLATRFVHRVLKSGKSYQMMTITNTDVINSMSAIETAERDMSAARGRVALEAPTRVSEGGIGVGGGMIRLGDQDWEKR